jgi:predicted TIM-barrel fold metal-dependent hydrolase
MFSYWARAKDGLVLSQMLNDHIAEVVDLHPKRFIGLGTLPMQDPGPACQEIRRGRQELKLCGFQIGSNVNQLNLSDPQFLPLYETLEEHSSRSPIAAPSFVVWARREFSPWRSGPALHSPKASPITQFASRR